MAARHGRGYCQAMQAAEGDCWVFGYGSLMWRPGFAFTERRAAIAHGRRRAFCIYSVHHRGTPARPGLVLGLAPGGAARGVAYRVAADAWAEVYAYLREREQPTETYFEAWAPVRLAGGEGVEALVFLSDRNHPQWAGDLDLEAQAKLIAGATGLSGRNVDYLRDLVSHLREQGVADRTMERLLVRVEALEATKT
ncbi:MAG TPA: gamma-glutamylcyclotransferase [Caulobacteraceae bacterium]|jgi:cation transport protein ChaC